MAYERGKKALGQCDRCGFTYKLSELQYELFDSKRNGLRVCYECLQTFYKNQTFPTKNSRLINEFLLLFGAKFQMKNIISRTTRYTRGQGKSGIEQCD